VLLLGLLLGIVGGVAWLVLLFGILLLGGVGVGVGGGCCLVVFLGIVACWCCLVLLPHTYDVCGVVVAGHCFLLQQYCLMVLLGIVAGVAA